MARECNDQALCRKRVPEFHLGGGGDWVGPTTVVNLKLPRQVFVSSPQMLSPSNQQLRYHVAHWGSMPFSKMCKGKKTAAVVRPSSKAGPWVATNERLAQCHAVAPLGTIKECPPPANG